MTRWGSFVYAAFVVDNFTRRIVAGRVSCQAGADSVFEAAEPEALPESRLFTGSSLASHSDRGSQYMSIRYTGRLAEVGIELLRLQREGPVR